MTEHYFETEVRVALTSIVKVVETFMVKRDDEGQIVEEYLWSRRLAPLSE